MKQRFGGFGGAGMIGNVGSMGILSGIQGINQSILNANYPSQPQIEYLKKIYPNVNPDLFINYGMIPLGAVGRNVHNNLISNHKSEANIQYELRGLYNRLF